ncbi:camphor resistance protein CrcB [Salsuginibacillus halophilus]|uniref:Fluoride-specific ion channel FluC n=1 Tax=Salsuginibacillus halophilus TaxID=517424 RepID=A0A2P8HDV0_9BACI|nr:CrcB family protein [Salsuginibacillus halophilus]PSL44399.1 camphor resistance protein CrcB [Salsuginibacillus halophilus]
MFKNVTAIALGAAAGTLLRYILNLWTLETGYPLGTLLENTMGSLVLGALTGYFFVKVPAEWLKLGLGVGLCGGFTTFSTYASDTFYLAFEQSISAVMIYNGITLIGGISCALLGMILGHKLASRGHVKRGERA